MVNEFLMEIVNAAHMRLLSPDWREVKNGFDLLDTIVIRVHDKKLIDRINAKNIEVNAEYSKKMKEIGVINDPQEKSLNIYNVEFWRTKEMIIFYDNLIKDFPNI